MSESAWTHSVCFFLPFPRIGPASYQVRPPFVPGSSLVRLLTDEGQTNETRPRKVINPHTAYPSPKLRNASAFFPRLLRKIPFIFAGNQTRVSTVKQTARYGKNRRRYSGKHPGQGGPGGGRHVERRQLRTFAGRQLSRPANRTASRPISILTKIGQPCPNAGKIGICRVHPISQSIWTTVTMNRSRRAN